MVLKRLRAKQREMKGEYMSIFEKFKNDVVHGLEVIANDRFNIRVEKCLKNNGVWLTAVTAIRDNINISPTVYLEGFFGRYTSGVNTVDEIVEKIYGMFEEKSGRFTASIDMQHFLKWDDVKHHIYSKIINADMNRELLALIPHRLVMDLAEVYYVKAYCVSDDENFGTIQIFNNHASHWGVSEEELNRVAHENMERNEVNFIKLQDVINEYIDGELCLGNDSGIDADCESVCDKIYVLTNDNRNFGAAEFLRKDVLYNIADMLKSDIVILPSSLHEVIIVPSDKDDDEALSEMVKEINATQVAREDILSDHVYRYERATRVMSIAA